jgi:hypothetical protein
LIKVINRVIKARKRSQDYFDQLTEGKDKGKDGHAHFIEVLQDVLQKLEPLCREDCMPEAIPKTSESKTRKENATNIFENLTVEEPSNPPLQPQIPQADQLNTPITFEDDSSGDSSTILFAVYCLFQDVTNVRTFLQDLWRNKKAGKVDLITAAITTNTAIDLVKRLEEEFRTDSPEHCDYEDLFEQFSSAALNVYYKHLAHIDGLVCIPDPNQCKWLLFPAFIYYWAPDLSSRARLFGYTIQTLCMVTNLLRVATIADITLTGIVKACPRRRNSVKIICFG